MHKRTRRQKVILIAGLFACLLLIGLFILFLFSWEKSSRVRELLGDTGIWGNKKTPAHVLTFDDTDYAYTDDLQTYLLIGTDGSSETEENKGRYGDLADFLLVLVIDNTTESYSFFQIDRDTIADVDMIDEDGLFTGTFQEQICTAHWYGSTEEERNANTVSTVSGFLGGLGINGYYMLNMRDMDVLNDAVGGVTVTVEDDLTGIDPAMKKGAVIKLKGKQAEAFVRARMTVSDGTNVSRMRRQRAYMESFYTLVMSRIREDANYLNDLYDALSGKILSDQPHSVVSDITNRMYRYENKGVLLVDGESTAADTFGDGVLHTEFYPDSDSLLQVMQNLTGMVPVTDELLESVEIVEWKEAEDESDEEEETDDEDVDETAEEEADGEDSDETGE
ncbi:MAG: LCP family protein, partial [Eubacteriales bacterium]|nr:LCP family protein [Eubacteriales bacterium]